jgi:hypothetical protein
LVAMLRVEIKTLFFEKNWEFVFCQMS